MNKEIEVKVQADDKLYYKMQIWLNNNAKFLKEIHHLEYYINNRATSFFFTSAEGYKDALDYLRVRITKNGDYFCFKKFHEDPVLKRPLYCDEYEVKVSDGQITLELMKALGYNEQIRMEKIRKIYQYEDFEIVIDDVKDLGKFIEIEFKKPINDPKEGLQIIYDFLKSIGINKIKLQKRGYISMLLNPGFNFTQEIDLKKN